MGLDALVALLRGHAYRYTCERDLQDGIASVLATVPGIQREYRLSTVDRVDFYAAGIGIEVKCEGSLSALTRQLHRYVQHDAISALVLVTSRHRLAGIPAEMNGKLIEVVKVGTL